ncbi:hypothetical protein ACFZDK_52105 [Streptomyces sp. NPDC007901]|uniref:hypothetical protein n=1 Tax=Streptomyces sp. NPDC007901 TaxID=3364785 RepID=UPI0036E5C05D
MDFCQFLGDLVVTHAKTREAQDRSFCDLATGVTTVTRVRSKALPGQRLAQQHTAILRLADMPQLAGCAVSACF